MEKPGDTGDASLPSATETRKRGRP